MDHPRDRFHHAAALVPTSCLLNELLGGLRFGPLVARGWNARHLAFLLGDDLIGLVPTEGWTRGEIAKLNSVRITLD
jgi:hypothetical protein